MPVNTGKCILLALECEITTTLSALQLPRVPPATFRTGKSKEFNQDEIINMNRGQCKENKLWAGRGNRKTASVNTAVCARKLRPLNIIIVSAMEIGQHPELSHVCVACPCADADEISLSYDEHFLTGGLSFEKYKTLMSERKVRPS